MALSVVEGKKGVSGRAKYLRKKKSVKSVTPYGEGMAYARNLPAVVVAGTQANQSLLVLD